VNILVGADTSYSIVVRNPLGEQSGVSRASLDGAQLSDPVIRLAEDGLAHEVEVFGGTPADQPLKAYRGEHMDALIGVMGMGWVGSSVAISALVVTLMELG